MLCPKQANSCNLSSHQVVAFASCTLIAELLIAYCPTSWPCRSIHESLRVGLALTHKPKVLIGLVDSIIRLHRSSSLPGRHVNRLLRLGGVHQGTLNPRVEYFLNMYRPSKHGRGEDHQNYELCSLLKYAMYESPYIGSALGSETTRLVQALLDVFSV